MLWCCATSIGFVARREYQSDDGSWRLPMADHEAPTSWAFAR
jgi:hypothetical protein